MKEEQPEEGLFRKYRVDLPNGRSLEVRCSDSVPRHLTDRSIFELFEAYMKVFPESGPMVFEVGSNDNYRNAIRAALDPRV